MKKVNGKDMTFHSRLLLVTSCFYCIVTACNTATPEKYFDLAVLNTNMLMGFADEGFQYQLDNPSVKMVPGSAQPVAMQRIEVVDDKIKSLEENLEKLKGLKETADTREMVQHAINLYDFVLPVCRNEYRQLAKIYDGGGRRDSIELSAKGLHDKYYSQFDEMMKKLTIIGKTYATKHNIKVNWGR